MVVFHPEAGNGLERGFHGQPYRSRILVVDVPVVRQSQLRHDDEGCFSVGRDCSLGGSGCLGRSKISRAAEVHGSEVLCRPRT